MKHLLLLLFLFWNQVIISETLPVPFQISDLSTPVTLDANKSSESPWLLTSGLLDENQILNLNESNFSLRTWIPVTVPGNLAPYDEKIFKSKAMLLARWIKIPKKKSGNLSVRLGIISDRDKVFLNGHKIGETGVWNSPEPQAYDKIRIYPLPDHFVKYGELNLLLIQIQPYFSYTGGIEQDSTSIGTSYDIFKKFYKEEFTKLIFLTVYVTVGGYFLFLFIRRRRESENFFFALFSMGIVGYNLFRNQIKYDFDFSFLTMKRIEYSLLVILIPLMYHFIRKLFDFKYIILFKILDLVQLMFIVIFLVNTDISFYNSLTNNVIQPTWIFYVICILYYLIRRTKERNRQAYVVLLGISVVIIISVIDILSTRGMLVLPRLLGYAFLAFIVSLAIVLANSFVRLNEEVEDLNKNLEDKVKSRTDELNNTLKQVNNLKDQQDGDYFLTSLLINPLARNENKSKSVKTEFYTKQKKRFSFKGKENEIGGDICISTELTIQGKKYIVFINGDAMGKSIQGAGGALVLGVVFHAVISRTKLSNEEISPEIWMQNLFLELQSTFESFDGSMLTSIALGLIQEDTGFLYYVNAEHPWTILYRDGKASFIENELMIRKLGFPKNERNFMVKTFQLHPGDILVCGSDGRDDIALPSENLENRIINEDENLILKTVEKSNCNLSEIVKEIQAIGEITDDLTFIKISFEGESNFDFNPIEDEKLQNAKDLFRKGNLEAAKALLISPSNDYTSNHPTLALLGKIFFKQKNWKNAINFIEKALVHRPEKEEHFLMLTLSYFKLKDYKKALPWAERLRILNPHHHKNNVNLIYLYSKTDNKKKASYLLKDCLRDFPDNKDLLKLANQIL
jgi:hypothetical protein